MSTAAEEGAVGLDLVPGTVEDWRASLAPADRVGVAIYLGASRGVSRRVPGVAARLARRLRTGLPVLTGPRLGIEHARRVLDRLE